MDSRSIFRRQNMITIQQDDLNAALNAVTRASLKSSLMAAFSLVRLDVRMDGQFIHQDGIREEQTGDCPNHVAALCK